MQDMELSNKFVHAGGEIYRLPALASITQIAFFASSSEPFHEDTALSVRLHVDHDPTGFIAITKNDRAVEQFRSNLIAALGGMEGCDPSLLKAVEEAYQEAIRQKDLLIQRGEEKKLNLEAHGLRVNETLKLSWWRKIIRWVRIKSSTLGQ